MPNIEISSTPIADRISLYKDTEDILARILKFHPATPGITNINLESLIRPEGIDIDSSRLYVQQVINNYNQPRSPTDTKLFLDWTISALTLLRLLPDHDRKTAIMVNDIAWKYFDKIYVIIFPILPDIIYTDTLIKWNQAMRQTVRELNYLREPTIEIINSDDTISVLSRDLYRRSWTAKKD